MAMIKMSPEEIRAKSQSYGQGSDPNPSNFI